MMALKRFLPHSLFAALVVFPNGAMADPLENARQGYLRTQAEQTRLQDNITGLLERIEEDQKKLATVATEREQLVETVKNGRNRLIRLQTELRLERAKVGDIANRLDREWKKTLSNPKAYPATRQRNLRNSLAKLKQKAARLHGELEKLSPQINVRTEALAKATLDVAHTKTLTDIEARLFKNQALVNLLYKELAQQKTNQKSQFRSFLTQAQNASPAVVERVEISTAEGMAFQAIWANETLASEQGDVMCGPAAKFAAGPERNGNSRNERELANTLAELEAFVKTSRELIARNEANIDEITNSIAEIIKVQIKLGNDYARIFAEIAELKNDILLANTLADIGVVIVEVALTGGTATVARKSIEIGTEQLGKIAARRLRREVGSKAAKELLGKPKDVAKREFSEVFAKEALEAGVQKQGLASIRKRAGLLFDEVAQRAFDEHKFKLLGAKTGTIILRKGITKQAQTVAGANLPDTAMANALSGLGADAFEFGFDRAISFGAYKGHEAIEASGKKWNRAATVLRSVKPKDLKELLPTQPADVAGFVASVAKAAISYKIGLQIDDNMKLAITTSAQYQAMYKMHAELFEKRLNLQKDNDKLRKLVEDSSEQASGITNGLHSSRQLYIPVNNGLEEPETDYFVQLEFSKPLPKAPRVKLGNSVLSFPAKAGAVGETTWTAQISGSALAGSSPLATLHIEATDLAGHKLDRSPHTLPFHKLLEPGFHFYDPGADECIKVPVDFGKPVVLQYKGLKSEILIR